MKKITIHGAREHNLKNIDVSIPKNKLVVFTGLSGSGKSSLAFDTIYAEGQRRYVESLSSYARQFLGMMEKPDVDRIDGLSPAISIDQKSVSHNPRSTVGTTTEIYDYLRLLYARVGHPHCPECGREIQAQTVSQIADTIQKRFTDGLDKGPALNKGIRVMILAPLVKDRKGEYAALLDELSRRGHNRARIDNQIFNLDEDDLRLIKTNRHTIEVVIDRLVISQDTPRHRLTDSVKKALKLSDGQVIVSEVLDKSFEFPEKPTKFRDHLYSEKFACPECNISLPDLEPRSFSFNSPHGACSTCDGIGTKLEADTHRIINKNLTLMEGGLFPWANQMNYDSYPRRFLQKKAAEYNFDLNSPIKTIPDPALEDILQNGVLPYIERRYQETDSPKVRTKLERYMIEKVCPDCQGTRLNPRSLAVIVDKLNIAEASAMDIAELNSWLQSLDSETNFSQQEAKIAAPILKELIGRTKFLRDVGLDYLTLDRTSSTLSGGEAQRIRLASQIGSGLSGVLYVLDEPSIGLHARDHQRLLQTLKGLRDLGNTVIVVEHDLETMQTADWILDFGPGAGVHGGKIVAQGSPKQIMQDPNSLTGQYMKGKKIVHPESHDRQVDPQKTITIHSARQFNLKNIDISFPVGTFTCVTGVSGSGKSTLVMETLYKRLALELNHSRVIPGKHAGIDGLKYIDKVVNIDQSPIGKTPRSNPATYTSLFTPIRELFASLPESQARGYKKGRFSFNVKGGRCENCQGQGQNKIEMQFLPDIYVTCETCHGKRYNRETLEIRFKDKNIAEVLEMTVEEALQFFKNHPKIKQKLKTLSAVGLDYIQLGQPSPTLSGGEAQRVKLASELSKRATGDTIYILDEPTTGLHFADIEKLLHVLHKLVDQGNTVIVIEHHLDIIKTADWIIDLGPEGGDQGGELVTAGTPQDLIQHPSSYTGQYLKNYLKN